MRRIMFDILMLDLVRVVFPEPEPVGVAPFCLVMCERRERYAQTVGD